MTQITSAPPHQEGGALLQSQNSRDLLLVLACFILICLPGCTFAPRGAHSITSSASSRNDSGIESPNALAVLRLPRSAKLVGCTTGRSAGSSRPLTGRLANFISRSRAASATNRAVFGGRRPAAQLADAIGGS